MTFLIAAVVFRIAAVEIGIMTMGDRQAAKSGRLPGNR